MSNTDATVKMKQSGHYTSILLNCKIKQCVIFGVWNI